MKTTPCDSRWKKEEKSVMIGENTWGGVKGELCAANQGVRKNI